MTARSLNKIRHAFKQKLLEIQARKAYFYDWRPLRAYNLRTTDRDSAVACWLLPANTQRRNHKRSTLEPESLILSR